MELQGHLNHQFCCVSLKKAIAKDIRAITCNMEFKTFFISIHLPFFDSTIFQNFDKEFEILKKALAFKDVTLTKENLTCIQSGSKIYFCHFCGAKLKAEKTMKL